MESGYIILRIDVDYPYPSRVKSFLHIALNIKTSRDYLRNSKILAETINKSAEKVKAYWFFTTKTMPDNELLTLLTEDKHEVSLHVVNNPEQERIQLEKATKRKTRFYTIHGTKWLLARIIWKRLKTNRPSIPKDFPLQSFHEFPTVPLDAICYSHPTEQATRIAEDKIKEGKALEIHPIWLFQKGKINHRGPFYETLRRILRVDKESSIERN